MKVTQHKAILHRVYGASAPGTIVLLGEHAVLHNKMSLVCAINKRIYVTLRPRQDRSVHIKSDRLGSLVISLDNLRVIDPFQFVLSAIMSKQKRLHHGFDLSIKADFSAEMGFGSSAAVTVATLAVLHGWLGQRQPPLRKLFLEARHIIREVQGVGSGADVAASIWGGVVAYRVAPLLAQKIAASLPLTIVYSGKKVSTAKVVRQVMALRERHKKIIVAVEAAIEECVKEAMVAIKKQEWRRLGEIMNISQGLQDALGVNTENLAQIVFMLRQTGGIYGAKISGAGMGDCVIGIGAVKKLNYGKCCGNGLKIIKPNASVVKNVAVTYVGLNQYP